MNQTTKVTFIYDEPTKKWEVIVSGVTTPLEALQAFNAVLLTCRQATVGLYCNKAELVNNEQGSYKISIGQL